GFAFNFWGVYYFFIFSFNFLILFLRLMRWSFKGVCCRILSRPIVAIWGKLP
ncbi:hypothetical protein HMPREF1391_01268, partial [Helicobacter pylori GAM100Ai]